MQDQIQSQLDELALLQGKLEGLSIEKQERRDELLPAIVKTQLRQLDTEFEAKTELLNESIGLLDAEIRTGVISHGEKVKGTWLQALWVKGRVSWDAKGLEGYAVANPDVRAFRSEGNPSVTIRKA